MRILFVYIILTLLSCQKNIEKSDSWPFNFKLAKENYKESELDLIEFKNKIFNYKLTKNKNFLFLNGLDGKLLIYDLIYKNEYLVNYNSKATYNDFIINEDTLSMINIESNSIIHVNYKQNKLIRVIKTQEEMVFYTSYREEFFFRNHKNLRVEDDVIRIFDRENETVLSIINNEVYKQIYKFEKLFLFEVNNRFYLLTGTTLNLFVFDKDQKLLVSQNLRKEEWFNDTYLKSSTAVKKQIDSRSNGVYDVVLEARQVNNFLYLNVLGIIYKFEVKNNAIKFITIFLLNQTDNDELFAPFNFFMESESEIIAHDFYKKIKIFNKVK